MSARGGLVLVVLACNAGPATACPDAAAWTVTTGSLVPGRACGAWVGATNAETVAYSLGRFATAEPVTLPYRVGVRWRRLGADARPLELHLLGAVLLLAEDRIGVWIDDDSFSVDGYRPLAGYSTRDEHVVSAVQTAAALDVTVDGVAVGHWTLAPKLTRGSIAVAFKGGRATRARMWFADFVVESLQSAPQPASAARPK